MTNSNNNAPRIISNGGGSRAKIHVEENTKFVTDVETKDKISTEANGRLKYSIVGGNEANLFTIDRRTGVLEFKQAPDFENPIDDNRNNIYTVKVKVTDGAGFTDTQSIQVTVKDKAENRAPNARNDSAMTNADQNVHFNVLSNDSDPDGDRIFVKALEGEDLAADGNNLDRVTGDKGGVFTLFDNGSLKFDPRHDFEHLKVGESVVTTADYTISDGKGGHDTATISIQVKGTKQVNNAPDARNDSAMTDEGQSVKINVLGNDSDPDGDTIRVSSLEDADNGSVKLNSDGTVTYTPDAGFVGKDSFEYHISDGNGGTDTASVHVQVKDVNEAPIAKDDSAMTDEGQAVKINVLGNDSDPDGDAINVSSLEDASNGSVSLNSDGTVTYTPDAGFVGKDSFEYHISDGNGGTDTASVHIDVKDVNEAPIAKDDSAMTDEGQAVKINVLGNDSDPDGDAINVSSLEDASNGSVSLNNDGTVTYTPDAGFVGKDSFEYHISDGNGGIDTASVHIDVKEVPDEKNLIEGNDRNNHLNGTDGDDTIKGFGGWDTLNGNGGNDHLIGGAGLDTLNGGAGNDVINGTDAVNAGAGERDHAIGGSGMDTFILGDANRAYYTAEGNRDFLRISDFEVGVDKVQLFGSKSDYHVDGNKLCIGDETIAIFDNLDSINLNSGDFEFV